MVILGQEPLGKPKCASPGCENDALIMIGKNFYCGECTVLFNDARDKALEEEMKNARKNLPTM